MWKEALRPQSCASAQQLPLDWLPRHPEMLRGEVAAGQKHTSRSTLHQCYAGLVDINILSMATLPTLSKASVGKSGLLRASGRASSTED